MSQVEFGRGLICRNLIGINDIFAAPHQKTLQCNIPKGSAINALKEIADARQQMISGLVTAIKTAHQQGNLSSAIRQFVLAYYRERPPISAGS